MSKQSLSQARVEPALVSMGNALTLRSGKDFGHVTEDLLTGLRSRDQRAMAAFFDENSPDVLRILRRVLGNDPELADLVQEVFTRALACVDQVREASSLRSWLVSIAVFVGRECIRKRKRRWWLRFVGFETEQEHLDDIPGAPVDWQAREALRSTYDVLDKLNVDERIVFSLRFLEGMELTQVADACGVSLATAKRRIKKAQDTFFELAKNEPALAEWVERGSACEAE